MFGRKMTDAEKEAVAADRAVRRDREIQGLKRGCLGCLGLIGGSILTALLLLTCLGIDDESPNKTPEQKRLADAACRQDLQCLGAKHSVAAALRCDDLVERQAKYSHEWTDGILEPKFSHYRWKDKAAGIVTYIGDKVRFQNGFGAWVNMVYECDLDTNTQMPVDVRVSQGRL